MSEQAPQPKGSARDIAQSKATAALEQLCKWRTVFASRFLGTFPRDFQPGVEYKETVERTLILRAELSALTRLLLEKKVITDEEFLQHLHDEAKTLDRMLEAKFPGFKTTPTGLMMDAQVIRDNKTMEGWPP